MIPIFKTNYSIGKSIFTLSESSEEGGPPSLVELAKREKLKKVVLIEECMTGFPEAFKKLNNKSTSLIFGLVFMFGEKDSSSKLIAIAKNDDGAKALNKIHTEHSFSNFVSDEFLSNCDIENLQICVPFYDSFLFKNVMEYEQIAIDLKKYSPIFFLQNNGLPFDPIIASKVKKYCGDFGFDFVEVKSIYYENESDAEAFQAYKIITSRKGFKNPNLSRPNLEHFGSRKFCWESFKKEAVNERND